jgi:hypothetical protein
VEKAEEGHEEGQVLFRASLPFRYLVTNRGKVPFFCQNMPLTIIKRIANGVKPHAVTNAGLSNGILTPVTI